MYSLKIILITFVVFIAFQVNAEQWPDSLNTANNVNYLNQLEKDVIFELNKARSNPSKYADEVLSPLLDAYQGKTLTFPGQIPIITQEGKKALEECIRILKRNKALPILFPSPGLTDAAIILANEQEKHGGLGHIGRNGSTPRNRVDKIGDWSGNLAENITYGSATAFQVVANLLIDDGVPNRSHRVNILNENFKVVGVAERGHPSYNHVCVMDFATTFKSK